MIEYTEIRINPIDSELKKQCKISAILSGKTFDKWVVEAIEEKLKELIEK